MSRHDHFSSLASGRLLIAMLALALILSGCAPGLSAPPGPLPSEGEAREARPIPTATPFPIGSGQPAPIRESVALLRAGADGPVAGAALIVTSDGYLLTAASVWRDDLVVYLPDGTKARPIRVAADDATGLALLKVPGRRLIPIRLSTASLEAGMEAFAAGFDVTRGEFGEIGGRIRAVPDKDAGEAVIQTSIPASPGFQGGALSDLSGALLGILVGDRDGDGQRTLTAVPEERIIERLETWRAETDEIIAEGQSWPTLSGPGGLSLRYPAGWSLMGGDDGDRYLVAMRPGDPDVPLEVAISIEPRTFDGDPMAFAAEEFGSGRSARVWGEVSYAGIPGVRLLLEQEGARLDLVYLFTEDRQIAIRVTSGYPVDDIGPQARRAGALLEALLQSLTIEPDPARSP